jgi:glucose-1-phosphate cytidylyltransferase
MKVVIFCGGKGMRMRDFDQRTPKPLAPIGQRPVIWHVMKYYAYYGHTDFILCLGYGAQQIKDYFINYQEWDSNDFTLTRSSRSVTLHESDLDEWTISFVDTGHDSLLGERLRRVRHLLDDETFLCNYADSLTDCSIDDIIKQHYHLGATATILAGRPTRSLHVLEIDDDSHIEAIGPMNDSDIWVNGGYMVLEPEIFDVIHPGEELVEEPFHRLAAQRQLAAYRYSGHWMAVDTFKDRQEMEDLWVAGKAPWAKWRDTERVAKPHSVPLTPPVRSVAAGS